MQMGMDNPAHNTLSVVELKVLRQRLQAGQESKARRGELFKRLPVGYVLDAMGKVVLHPDRRVGEAVQLVFGKFRERWTVRQTFQWFRDHDVALPANPIRGTQLVWKIPTQSLIRDIYEAKKAFEQYDAVDARNRLAAAELEHRWNKRLEEIETTKQRKGGVHTQLEVERPTSVTETATPIEALEIIRRMAVRHGDDQIASVLNRLGYSTGKGKRWNQNRVATARHNHSIAGQKRALPDPDSVSLSEAARLCRVSHRTIERLVDAGLLKRGQTAPRAPWRIRRADLNAESVTSIVKRLHQTGSSLSRGGLPERPATFIR